MHPLLFVTVLAVLSLAMVHAMVQFTRAVLLPAPGRRAWGVAYVASWIAVAAWVILYAGPAPILAVVALAWFSVHAAMVWLGMRLRTAAQRRPAPSRVTALEEDEEEEAEEEDDEAPRVPTLRDRIIAAAQMIGMLLAAIAIIAIGENMASLRRLDAALAPFRGTLLLILGITAGAGFLLFLGGTLAFVLRGPDSETERGIEEVHARRLGITRRPVQRDSEITLRELAAAWQDGTWRDRPRIRRFFVIGAGVASMLAAGAAFGVVAASPGIKLLILLTAAWVALRIAWPTRARGA